MSPNTITFIGLCQEYCNTLENATQTLPAEFVKTMLRLLPRIYITATDIQASVDEPRFIEGTLEEDYYDSIRRGVENLLGPDDMYLEVFEQDMKYSDTPIAASISEGLADLFQEYFNFLATVRDAPDDVTDEALAVVREDFQQYWSRTLCNLLRALNHIRYADTLQG